METAIKRLCKDCNDVLLGRMDKKFCNDHCRSNYNNRERAENDGVVKAINLILKRNRNILEKFNPNGKALVNRIKLEAAGFDPNYHTHTSDAEDGHHYTYCYEQGYQKLASGDFLLNTARNK